MEKQDSFDDLEEMVSKTSREDGDSSLGGIAPYAGHTRLFMFSNNENGQRTFAFASRKKDEKGEYFWLIYLPPKKYPSLKCHNTDYKEFRKIPELSEERYPNIYKFNPFANAFDPFVDVSK